RERTAITATAMKPLSGPRLAVEPADDSVAAGVLFERSAFTPVGATAPSADSPSAGSASAEPASAPASSARADSGAGADADAADPAGAADALPPAALSPDVSLVTLSSFSAASVMVVVSLIGEPPR